MMPGVSATSDPRPHDEHPTTVLPLVSTGQRQYEPVGDGRRVMWVAVAGAVVAIVAAALMVAFAGGDNTEQPGPALVLPRSTDVGSLPPTNLPTTEAASPSPT